MLKHPRCLRDRIKEKGMATMMTAFSMVMLVPICGLALDGGLAYIVKTRLSAAADSSALAAARGLNGGATIAAAQSAAQNYAATYFDGNFPAGYLNTDPTAANRSVHANFVLGTGTNGVPNGVLQVAVVAQVKSATYFMKWLGYGNLPIAATGTATRRLLVMTLVLDKSASMGTRSSAVGSVPTSLSNAASSCEAMVYSSIQFLNNFTPYDYIGVVPFDYTAYATFPPTTSWGGSSGAQQTIANIQCGNNTNTAAALNLAYTQIQAVNLPLANNVVVLFTDGVPNGVTANFPLRTQADTRLSTFCGTDSNGRATAQCQVPACTTTAGTISRAVITQVNGFDPVAVSLAGPFKAFSTDATPTVPGTAAACPQSGTDFAQKTVAYIPDQDAFGNNTYGPWDGANKAGTTGVCASGRNCTSLASPAPSWLYQVNSHTAPSGTPITSGNSASKNLGDSWSNFSTTGWGAPYNTFTSGPYSGKFRPDTNNAIGVVSMNTATNQAISILANTSFRPTIHAIYLQGNAGDPVDKAFLQMVTNQPQIAPIIYEATSYNSTTQVYTYPTTPDPSYANPNYNSNYQQGLFLATTSTTALNSLFLQVASSVLRISQ